MKRGEATLTDDMAGARDISYVCQAFGLIVVCTCANGTIFKDLFQEKIFFLGE